MLRQKTPQLFLLLALVLISGCGGTGENETRSNPESHLTDGAKETEIKESTFDMPGFIPAPKPPPPPFDSSRCSHKAIATEKGFLWKLIMEVDSIPIDTIPMLKKLIHLGLNTKDGEVVQIPRERSFGVLFPDLNGDGYADLVYNNMLSASHGGSKHYTYLFQQDSTLTPKNLPIFNGGIRVDNGGVYVTCPYGDCEARYEFKDSAFVLVDGLFEVNP